MKIAIIGTGISGLAAAHYLARRHTVTVYEKNPAPGGHGRTIMVSDGGNGIPVDTGFIVFNDRNYPRLMRLFDELGVEYVKSDMSFGVRAADEMLEYSSRSLFAPRNIARPAYLRMLVDILRFNRAGHRYMNAHPSLTLGACLDRLGMGRWFREYYLLAMGAAIWSSPPGRMADFPARSFLRFFHNHGLLGITGRPQWFTVKGGARVYIERITKPLTGHIRLDCGVRQVTRRGGKWQLADSRGQTLSYDRVVFACHADEALAMLAMPAKDVARVLGAFSYEENKIIVHGDTGFMPERKDCWASWVYLAEGGGDKLSMTYWMNNLQPLDTATPILVTLNPTRRPDEHLIHDEHVFTHPVFDAKAIAAQKRIASVQGRDGLWFCGAYHGHGFHEDGLASAINMTEQMEAAIQ